MDYKQKAENLVSKYFDLTNGDKFGNAIECAIIACDECISNRIRSGRASVVKSENNKNQYWQLVRTELLLMKKSRSVYDNNKLLQSKCTHPRTERAGFVDQCRCLDCGKWI